MMNFKKLFLFASVLLLVVSCHQNEIFFQFKKVSDQGWSQDSIVRFDVRVTDKNAPYKFFIHVRHKSNYPYQNIWLFLEQTNPDKTQTKDSVEAYLSDQYGKWLGSGAGSLKEMQIFYQQQFHFPDTGTYRFGIRQGMRDSLLQGINDVGIRIEKADK